MLNNMRIIRVRITFKDGEERVYEVLHVQEIYDEVRETNFLAMARKKDGGIGYVPMDAIENYEILTD